LLKNLTKNILLIAILWITILSVSSSHAKVPVEDHLVSWSGNIYKNIHKYKKIHGKFFKKSCTPGTEFKYHKLLKRYRGTGHYLPLVSGDVDKKAIRKNLKTLQAKIKFIKGIESRLNKQKKLPYFKVLSQDITTTVNKLLEYKKKYFLKLRSSEKVKLIKKSSDLLLVLNKQFGLFMEQIYFLKSYNYPNNHLENRSNYEAVKDKLGDKNKTKANSIFFYRKLVEDGAFNPNHTRPDIYTRSTLDTIYFGLKHEKETLSENLRYDLEWVLKRVKVYLAYGVKKQRSRIKEWRVRSEKKLTFYRELINTKNKAKAKKLALEKNEASSELKEFVYAKQAQTYKFWASQPKLWKALFALETIIYNEVGVIDGKDALERKDVAQIVMNRVSDNFYHTLSEEQILVRYLKLANQDYSNEYWLNTLFRVGEFSFTYHYISSVVKIFCPDMSRRGKVIRDKNLKISLKSLKNPRPEFDVFRYFSRVSMLGKIDMSSVWSDYARYRERPGYEAKGQRRLTRKLLADKFQFLYKYLDPKGISYQVIKVDDVVYSMTWVRGRPKFFKYRSPHLFTYFTKI